MMHAKSRAQTAIYRSLDGPCAANKIARLPDSRPVGYITLKLISRLANTLSLSVLLIFNLPLSP